MKRLIVLAGPNGSGKSSVISEIKDSPNFPELYLNPDEHVKEFSNIPDEKLRYKVAMDELQLLRKIAIDNCLFLAFETVFSTKEKLEFLYYAKEHGYHVEVVYITTCDPTINVARVNKRVSMGGHNVSPEKIISRYYRSMELLPEIIKAADTIKVYDNSEENGEPFIVFFKKESGEAVLLNKEKRNEWVSKYILPLYSKKEIFDLNLSQTKIFMEKFLSGC
jgi:predicted ABC-type ATPase